MQYRKQPPAATVNRMARYLNYLTMLPPDVDRVSSQQISKALNIKPTQFRQDFHYFGGFGRPGRGYDRGTLIDVLEQIMGVDQPRSMILVGLGHLGTALVNYHYFERMNLHLIGVFDINPKLTGLTIRGMEIKHPDKIPEMTQKTEVHIGIITTPPENARETLSRLVNAGVNGIWNFTPVQMMGPSGVVVRNEQPALGLLSLTFRLNEMEYASDPDLVRRKASSVDSD